jgi:sec-independent protein translocase protein TatC
MTLIEHLAELRSRLVKSILAVTLGATLVFLFYNTVLSWLSGPYTDVCAAHASFHCTGQFIITGPLEGFATRLKVSGYGGLIVALPVVLWQLWRFITPGLHPSEKRYAIPFLLSAVALFALGATIAFLTLPKALEFLVSYSGSVQPLFTPNNYVSLVILMMLCFGLSFLFPLVLIFLEIAGVLTPQKLAKVRRYAWVGIWVVVAVVTPSGDPYTLVALSVPLCIFYEVSIVVGRLLQRSKAKAALRAAEA